MRKPLHAYRLDVMGQCDPFDATVDAAIFVAETCVLPVDHETLFVQARYRWREDEKRSEARQSSAADAGLSTWVELRNASGRWLTRWARTIPRRAPAPGITRSLA